MNYNYNDLFNYLNLQQKKIKDIITEAQKALETLEFNRHLLERHMMITLRLHEITTRLEIINSRMDEIKDDQRLFNLGLWSGSQPQLAPQGVPAARSNGEPQTAPSPEIRPGALDGQGTTSPDSDGKAPSPATLPETSPGNSATHSQIIQLEIIELNNQQVKLKNQKNHFETELKEIEKQLAERGIGAAQG